MESLHIQFWVIILSLCAFISLLPNICSLRTFSCMWPHMKWYNSLGCCSLYLSATGHLGCFISGILWIALLWKCLFEVVCSGGGGVLKGGDPVLTFRWPLFSEAPFTPLPAAVWFLCTLMAMHSFDRRCRDWLSFLYQHLLAICVSSLENVYLSSLLVKNIVFLLCVGVCLCDCIPCLREAVETRSWY